MLANLNDVLKPAQKGHYGVGLFNTIDTDMLEAVISAAEELRSPVIIGTAEVLLPYGELDLIAPAIIAAAKRASVPVVVHYDHGLTVERCRQALGLGFTSIMFDGSAGSPEDNIRETAKMVALKRLSNDPYQCTTELVDINDVANLEKKVPVEWINEARTDMLPEFLSYARPLIQAELTPIYINGLTQHIVEE